MVLVNIIALIFIVGSGVTIFVALNWREASRRWRRFKSYGISRIRWRIRNFWAWFKRWCVGIIRNPASLLLCIASVSIAVALWVFGFDIYDLYDELHRQIDEGNKTPEEYRGIAIRYFGIVAGAGAVIGYIIAIARNITANNQNKVAEEQNRINERGRITESMVQAIAQIGTFNGDKPNIEIRLGGLYSLQRIMQDSPKDGWTIAKIFTAYVRENAKVDKTKKAKQKKPEPREDVQAALDIIGEFDSDWREKHDQDITFYSGMYAYSIDLPRVDFRGYNLECFQLEAVLNGANLSGQDLSNRSLCGASLIGADLSGALLCNSDLSSADLSDANLSGVEIFNVHLSYTNLYKANFSGADLSEINLKTASLEWVNLSGAKLSNVDFDCVKLLFVDLSNADLTEAINLTQEQINQAFGNKNTKLPEGLIHPKYWDYEQKKPKKSKKTP